MALILPLTPVIGRPWRLNERDLLLVRMHNGPPCVLLPDVKCFSPNYKDRDLEDAIMARSGAAPPRRVYVHCLFKSSPFSDTYPRLMMVLTIPIGYRTRLLPTASTVILIVA